MHYSFFTNTYPTLVVIDKFSRSRRRAFYFIHTTTTATILLYFLIKIEVCMRLLAVPWSTYTSSISKETIYRVCINFKKLMDQLQKMAGQFIEMLVRNEIMIFYMPQNSFLENAGEVMGWKESSESLQRSLQNVDTSHKYTQLLAIAAIVVELHACMVLSCTCTIKLFKMNCSTHYNFSERSILFIKTSVPQPIGVQFNDT